MLRAADRLWRTRLAAMRDVERLRIDVAAVRFEDGRAHVEYVAGAIAAIGYAARCGASCVRACLDVF